MFVEYEYFAGLDVKNVLIFIFTQGFLDAHHINSRISNLDFLNYQNRTCLNPCWNCFTKSKKIAKKKYTFLCL